MFYGTKAYNSIKVRSGVVIRGQFVVYYPLSRGHGDHHWTECRAETDRVAPPFRYDDGEDTRRRSRMAAGVDHRCARSPPPRSQRLFLYSTFRYHPDDL